MDTMIRKEIKKKKKKKKNICTKMKYGETFYAVTRHLQGVQRIVVFMVNKSKNIAYGQIWRLVWKANGIFGDKINK